MALVAHVVCGALVMIEELWLTLIYGLLAAYYDMLRQLG